MQPPSLSQLALNATAGTTDKISAALDQDDSTLIVRFAIERLCMYMYSSTIRTGGMIRWAGLPGC